MRRNASSIFLREIFGYLPLSDTDHINIAEGRTRCSTAHAAYSTSCCSRAVKDLAVVVFVPDVAAARAAVLAEGLFLRLRFEGSRSLA